MSSNPKRKAEPPTEIVLPITPMLDMAFQLMFFFLATFHPATAAEGQMDLSLPSQSAAAAKSPDKVNLRAETHKEEVEDKSDVTITVRGYKDPENKGRVSALTLTNTTGKEEIGGTPQERENRLAERLKNLLPPGENKKVPTVRIEADSEIRWSEVVKVMDVCYREGFQVSFAKPPDFGMIQ
jgi:biopolymer transport protein ExbD